MTKHCKIQSRQQTTEKIRCFLYFSCELAALKTNALFSDDPNVISLNEVNQVSAFVRQVYYTILEIYQQSCLTVPTVESPEPSQYLLKSLDIMVPKISTLDQLCQALNPVLARLKHHMAALGAYALGFITTQFHFTSEEILKRLSPIEQILISPYFKFVEEQVCIPWAQICTTAAQYDIASPTLILVEQFLRQSQSIAVATYEQVLQRHPNVCSRRGNISHPRIRTSMLRDLIMMQAYLGLCILENSTVAIEQTLLPLCLIVFRRADVPWFFVEQVLELLMNTLQTTLSVEQKELLQPYAARMQRFFQLTDRPTNGIDNRSFQGSIQGSSPVIPQGNSSPWQITIRAAELGDVQRIALLYEELLKPMVKLAEMAEQFSAVQDAANHQIYVADVGTAKTIGLIHARQCSLDEPHVLILGLVVEPNYRRVGIGQQLVQQVEDWALTQGCAIVMVRSNQQRQPIHPFYRKMGYREAQQPFLFRKEL